MSRPQILIPRPGWSLHPAVVSTPACTGALPSAAVWFIANIAVPKLLHIWISCGEFNTLSCPGLSPKELSQNNWGWDPNIHWFLRFPRWLQCWANFGKVCTRIIGPFQGFQIFAILVPFIFPSNCSFEFSKLWSVLCAVLCHCIWFLWTWLLAELWAFLLFLSQPCKEVFCSFQEILIYLSFINHFSLFLKNYLMCMGVNLPSRMSIYHMHVCYPRKALNSSELELQIALRYHVDIGNKIG